MIGPKPSIIRSGCPQHPDYKGKGTPDPRWTELVAAMNELLKDTP